MKRTSLCILMFGAIFCSLWQCSWSPDHDISQDASRETAERKLLHGHRWWNYYQSGLSYVEQNDFSNAIADFQQAITKRDRDQRMARSYGMHFIDYFPHRELGIALLKAGKVGSAEKHLNISLSHTPSAKARFYLDKVRKLLIGMVGGDGTPPVLVLDFENDEIRTKEHPVIVSGKAIDSQYVSQVRMNGIPVFHEGSQTQIRFRKALDLPQGQHKIELEATNLWGGVTKRCAWIHVDREGPLITVEDVQVSDEGVCKWITVTGFLCDESGISGFSINGNNLDTHEGVEIPFRFRFVGDQNSLDMVAEDCLGNRTTGRIPKSTFYSQLRPVLVASAGIQGGSIASEAQLGLFAGLFRKQDRNPPVIQLRDWSDTGDVFLEKIYLEGQVTDDSRIESLSVNGVAILRRKARGVVFGHMVELAEGENRIIIEARDGQGNTSVKSLTVRRHIPKALHLSQRLSVTILPFGHEGMMSLSRSAFYENLIVSMVDRNRFRVVEREKLDSLFSEQQLSLSKLVDRDRALRLGKLLAAQSVLLGTIIETRSGIEVIGRMVDTETSEVLSTQDVYLESKNLGMLIKMAEGMAVKFHHDFPLVDGLVMARNGDTVLTDLGDDVIKLGRRVIIYREIPFTHPENGRTVGSDNEILDNARIIQVLPDMSKAKLQKKGPGRPRPQDRVVSA